MKKVKTKWKLPFTIPLYVEIPKDMAAQIDSNLPLLDKQMKRLYDLIQKYKKEYNAEIERIRKKEEQEGKAREAQAERDMILYYDPVTLYQKLLTARVTAQEAKFMFLYVKDYSDVLSTRSLTPQMVKKAASFALGRINEVKIRTWLVEIEYYVK